MYCSKSLSFTVFLAVVASARSTIDRASRVRRDDPPRPSTYPIGIECKNEWQYLNFDYTTDTDHARLEKAHGIICGGEIHAIASYGQGSAKDNLAPYSRYFGLNEGDDPSDQTQAIVADVLGLIKGNDPGGLGVGGVIAGMIVDNKDFNGQCADGITVGYTDTDPVDNRQKMHFCDNAWAKGSIDTLDCRSLDPFPSTKMDLFSRVALHEMMHYNTVGPPSKLQDNIVDQKNEDNEYAYDPPRVHGLFDPTQDDQPGKCDTNADSYAWMSLDAYISRQCADKLGQPIDGVNWATFFKQNPPKYR